ncbi:hypothetical protein FACS189425_07250 [Clostridia bacterium]|nr:hypothetical protein FACS189425_07250 [Clostridia bacterium]
MILDVLRKEPHPISLYNCLYNDQTLQEAIAKSRAECGTAVIVHDFMDDPLLADMEAWLIENGQKLHFKSHYAPEIYSGCPTNTPVNHATFVKAVQTFGEIQAGIEPSWTNLEKILHIHTQLLKGVIFELDYHPSKMSKKAESHKADYLGRATSIFDCCVSGHGTCIYASHALQYLAARNSIEVTPKTKDNVHYISEFEIDGMKVELNDVNNFERAKLNLPLDQAAFRCNGKIHEQIPDALENIGYHASTLLLTQILRANEINDRVQVLLDYVDEMGVDFGTNELLNALKITNKFAREHQWTDSKKYLAKEHFGLLGGEMADGDNIRKALIVRDDKTKTDYCYLQQTVENGRIVARIVQGTNPYNRRLFTKNGMLEMMKTFKLDENLQEERRGKFSELFPHRRPM